MPLLTRRTALSLIGGTVLAAPFVKRARAEGTLAVYNWADYIGETTIEDFQNATGISVTYDNYARPRKCRPRCWLAPPVTTSWTMRA
jgi:spermidine/putrescine-binding protein